MARDTVRALSRQFIAFCIVGVVNTAVGLGVIFASMRFLALRYRLANILGYAVGLACSYTLNRSITFRAGRVTLRTSAVFLVVFLCSFAVQYVALLLLKEVALLDAYLAQGISLVTFTVVNFLGNRFLTFVDKVNA